MGFNRRVMMFGAGMALLAGCTRPVRGKEAGQSQYDRWTSFKAAFLDPSGRIVDNGNGGVSHSEGQGYGLYLALVHDDAAAFNLILEWTERNLARPDMALYSWRYDPRQAKPVGDPNNATDGDIFIAWALAGAARKWGEEKFAGRSAEIRKAIRDNLIVERFGRRLLLPGLQGFAAPDKVTLNLSYYVWPALDAFHALDGKGGWDRVIADGQALLALARFGQYELPADWGELTGHASLRPAMDRPPRFGFDAIRIPLYAHAKGRGALLSPIRRFWQAYREKGQTPPAWIDVVSGEAASYPLSEGGEAIIAKLNGIRTEMPLSSDYYAASLQMLAAALP
ncbi:MAG: glycosyl hydrolase family 8 [Sphingobium sp.]